MRVALVLGVCLTFVFAVESFVEDESFEDEEENEAGHHLRKCEEDDDCETGECCGRHWSIMRRCFAKRRLGQPCSVRPTKCEEACQDGLVCRRTDSPVPGPGPGPRPHGRHPHHHHKHFKCHPAPTEEPGSGDHDDI